MQRDLTKVDFAKKPTSFTEEFSRNKDQLLRELRQKERANGWVSFIKYIFTKEVWN